MEFAIFGDIGSIVPIAVDRRVRDRARLGRLYGSGRWRKRKGIALVEFANGTRCKAEVHWYAAHGIGRKELKIKRVIED